MARAMLFKKLCTYLARMEKTSSRLEMMAIFQEIFKQDADLEEDGQPVHDKIVYLCQGKLYPDWKQLPELQMAKELAKKAIAQASGSTARRVAEVFKQSGDLGATFAFLKQKGGQAALFRIEAPLRVSDVHGALEGIASLAGQDSQVKKVRALAGLLGRCNALEAKYVGRFVDGNMRLGTADLTMIEAVSRATGKDEEDARRCRAIIERAYNIYPDLGAVIKTALLEGTGPLAALQPAFGIPIRSMLAQRLESSGDFIEKHGGPFAAEYKLDGERVQVHKRGKDVILFSRRQEVITSQFPDVVEAARAWITAGEAILDGEIVAVDPASGKLAAFQVLMRRRRKHDVEATRDEVPTRVYLFDVLSVDGRSMLDEPYTARRAKLEAIVGGTGTQQAILPVTRSVIHDHDELVAFFNQAIADGTEGLLTKSLADASVYQPGARGWLWIKLKSLARGKLADALDLVVVGANMGEGRRSGVYGTLLVAAVDDDDGSLKVVTRVASGMTDELAAWFFSTLEAVPSRPSNVVSTEVPDAWIRPAVVLEVIGDEITGSPQSAIGYSIRFPRIVRVREDKGVEDCSTVSELLALRGRLPR